MDVTLDCPGSDSDNDQLEYMWIFGGNELIGENTNQVTVNAPQGQTAYSCTVTDSYGAFAVSEQLVTINPEFNNVPTAVSYTHLTLPTIYSV